VLKILRNKLIWYITFLNAIFPCNWLHLLETRLRVQRWPERHSLEFALHITPELFRWKRDYYQPNHINKFTGERLTNVIHISVPFVVTHRFCGAMIGKPGDLVEYCGEFSDGEVALVAVSKGIFDLRYEAHYDNPDVERRLKEEIQNAREEL